jgi:hypothetical protein
VAETIGRPVYELEEELPLHELLEWRAFWKLKAAAEARAREKAEREGKNKRGGRRSR